MNKKEELKALGADEVISTSDENVLAKVKNITGGKLAYGALDAMSGELTKQVTTSVKDGGQVLISEVMANWYAKVGMADLFRGVCVTSWNLPKLIKISKKRREFINEVSKFIRSKVIVSHGGETYDIVDFQLVIKKSKEVG